MKTKNQWIEPPENSPFHLFMVVIIIIIDSHISLKLTNNITISITATIPQLWLLICSKIPRLTFLCSTHWFKYIQKQTV